MTPDAFRAELTRLGLSQVKAGKVLGADERTVRRWASGVVQIPRSVALLLPRLTRSEVEKPLSPPPVAEG